MNDAASSRGQGVAVLWMLLLVPGCQGCSHEGLQPRDSRKLAAPSATRAASNVAATEVSLPQATTAVAQTDPPPQVRISEVLFDPLLLDEGAGEYLELVNLSNRSVRLADLTVALPTGRRVAPERPHLPWLRPGEVAVARATGRHPDLTLRGLRLPNTAGRVVLLWRDQPVDAAQWVVQRRRSRPGVALERRDPRLDGSLPAAWRPATARIHHVERGSPGAIEWPCAALATTALAPACDRRVEAKAARDGKNAKGRNLCNSGPAVGRWGGT